jgi:hypothetical protein
MEDEPTLDRQFLLLLFSMASRGGRGKGRRVRLGNVSGTDVKTVKFESASGSLDDRKQRVMLTLKDEAYDKKKAYRLVLTDVDTSIEQQSVEVIIDRAFTDDF